MPVFPGFFVCRDDSGKVGFGLLECLGFLRFLSVWGKQWGKLKHRQRLNRSVNVKQSRVGVDVRGQLRIAVTHRGLSRAE